MGNTKYTILLFSFEPWGNMWYSKQHYATELARKHTVYFISPPDQWRLSDLFNTELSVEHTPEGVTVVNYRNRLPVRLLPKWLRKLLFMHVATQLSQLLAPANNILWSFHPNPLVLQPALSPDGVRSIYHVVDPYGKFEWDVPCAKQADLIVVINRWYEKRYTALNPRTILIPHGARPEDSEFDLERSGQWAAWQPYIVLAGSMNKTVNYDLLVRLAQGLPTVNLLVAGKLLPVDTAIEEQRSALFGMPNVQHVGTLHPSELRTLLHGARCGLIAYDFEPYSKEPDKPTRTPLKAISYLAQHLPVVSTINCFIPEFEGSWIHKAANEGEFISMVRKLVEEDASPDPTGIDRYLHEIRYEHLIERIFGALQGKSPEAFPVSRETGHVRT